VRESEKRSDTKRDGIRGQHRREVVLPFFVVHRYATTSFFESIGALQRLDRISWAEISFTVR
jgi:hypothetical protein